MSNTTSTNPNISLANYRKIEAAAKAAGFERTSESDQYGEIVQLFKTYQKGMLYAYACITLSHAKCREGRRGAQWRVKTRVDFKKDTTGGAWNALYAIEYIAKQSAY